MEITQYYFIPRTFLEAICHKISNNWFNPAFNNAWIYQKEPYNVSLDDSFAMFLMGGEI